METKEKEKTSEPKFLNLHELEQKKSEKQLQWIKTMNRQFRVLFKFRDQKNYSLIGAGTVFKLLSFEKSIEAFSKALDSKEQVIPFDVKNVLRIKFYSK